MRLGAALVLFLALEAAAAPFAVQLGDVKIGLDAPPGFTDTTATGSPRFQELAESLTSASNRILLFAVPDSDMRRFQVGDQLELRRYMIVVTPRSQERERVSEATFKQFTTDALQALGKPAPADDYLKHLESRPTGEMSLLAELKRERDLLSVLQGARTKGGWFQSSEYLLATTTLMLVRGRALTLSVFTRYQDPADLEWIRVTTARWVDELKRLNPR